ncbi:hypothetical protein HRbin35_00447 [bacterium HR35]|nr:hypothetical protein HRbin35_00447 [bacterium HR35]
MMDLTIKIDKIFNESIKTIKHDYNCSSFALKGSDLKTDIVCNHSLYFDSLKKLCSVFNNLFKKSNNKSDNFNEVIKIFITNNKDIFREVKYLFQNSAWLTNYEVEKFNKATYKTSKAKCTNDEKFYIIKCYEYLYCIYNTESNYSLIVTSNEKKAITMINILLLIPYLACGDLYAIHGGLVSNGKYNILITGPSLSGKTTFSLLFLENNWQIVTEETTYITKFGKILDYNVRNYFNIRIGTYFEFKDFLNRCGIIIKNSFLDSLIKSKKQLFQLGKKKQISIYFENLCKERNNVIRKTITHVLDVSLKKNATEMAIKKINPVKIVNRFLEISFAPTTELFRKLIKFNKFKEEANMKRELNRLFRNVKCYSVISGLDYKKNFNFLLNAINLE